MSKEIGRKAQWGGINSSTDENRYKVTIINQALFHAGEQFPRDGLGLLNRGRQQNKRNKPDITGNHAIKPEPYITPWEPTVEDSGHKLAINLFDLQKLNIEDELGVAGDAGESLLAVGELRRNGDTTLTTGGHAGNTNVPALDDLTLTQLEGERLALLVGVEDLAVLELTNVAHGNDVASLGSNTLTELLVVNLDATNLLHSKSAGGLVTGGGRALLEVLGELNLLVGLGLLLGLDGSSGAIVLLELLLLSLLLGLAGLALGALGDLVIKALLLSGALVLSLSLGLNELRSLLLLAFNLGDTGVLHIIQIVALIAVKGHDIIEVVELILIGGQVVVILLLVILILIELGAALIKANHVVTSDENSVVTGGLEEDTLTLADGDVKGLLPVL